MDQSERLDFLIEKLLEESDKYKGIKWEEKDAEKLFHTLRNVRMPKPIDSKVLEIQDEYLQEELNKKNVLTLKDIATIKDQYKSHHKFNDKLSIWQGDITRLKIDAIVNAANSDMLGCFAPLHMCIDNVIHTAAGMQLREECNEYMEEKRINDKNYKEPTGSAITTGGYNLPSKYIIHTVGPIVADKLNEKLKNDLRNSYKSILKASVDKGIRSIAFCCISTGVFNFPNKEAAEIAVATVTEFLEEHEDKIDRIIFNVFKDLDKEIYEEILK